MRSLKFALALTLAFGSLFLTPAAHAQTIQFTFFWTAHEFTFTDQRVTITVTNNITNSIGHRGEIVDTYRITVGSEVLEVTEKHDAKDYVFDIVETQVVKLEGIDRGFWAGLYGPIITISATEPEENQTQSSESPALEQSEAPTESATPTPSPEITEPPSQVESSPPQPSAAEVKEIAEDVLADYDAFWARHGINEADYSQARQVITFNWAKGQYLQLIAEGKRTKATIAAMSMKSQLSVIERDYLAGRLMPNPAPLPEPTPAPAPQTSSPEPISPEPSPTPSEETTPEVTSSPIPPVVEILPSPAPPSLPKPEQTLPTIKPEPSLSEPVSQSESSEVISASPSISEEVVEIPEASQSDSVSATVSPTGIEETLGAVISIFATAGLDMTPEQREKAQGVIVPSVIAAQIATLAMRRIK